MLELQDACRIIGAVLECMELHCTEYELTGKFDRRYKGFGAPSPQHVSAHILPRMYMFA